MIKLKKYTHTYINTSWKMFSPKDQVKRQKKKSFEI